jgi:xanthine dehydrogenase accessory factor
MDRIPEIALSWARDGKGAALATVTATWGSAPRPVGAQLAVSGEGEIEGSVSGGCIEGAVVAEALEAMADGRPRELEYGVSDDDAFAVGLACGGTIRVLVEPVDRGDGPALAFLGELVSARAARRPVIAEVIPGAWTRRLIAPGAEAEADARFHADLSGYDGAAFRAVHNPPLRLMVIGAVHVAQALLPMAALLGFDVTLIDPRDAFASETRFPGTEISRDRPDSALARLKPDARTAIVTLTHDPKLDDPGLAAALAGPAFYVGCLGSKKTHAARLERLAAAGVPAGSLARLHAPVGLPIGAKSPAEIALSILAEITLRLRKPETRPG